MAWAGGASAQACFDPAQLSIGDLSLRRSLNFQDHSADAKRRCGLCAFFTAANPAACGRCAILSGGAVDAFSVCDSWAGKP